MKAQMRFQKIMCLIMIIVGALALLYAFAYSTGGLAELGQSFEPIAGQRVSAFKAREGKYDATLSTDIQGFNNFLMYVGIISILLAVVLYVTACNSRRNYYISNYVAIGVCAGGNFILALVSMILNGVWMSRFLNVDFEAWQKYWAEMEAYGVTTIHYSESTTWFVIGFAVYAIVIIASVFLVLNLLWKMKLMEGEKRLLEASQLKQGGAL